jgi:hypothetical protein
MHIAPHMEDAKKMDRTHDTQDDGTSDRTSRGVTAARRLVVGRGGGPPGGSAFRRREAPAGRPLLRRISATPVEEAEPEDVRAPAGFDELPDLDELFPSDRADGDVERSNDGLEDDFGPSPDGILLFDADVFDPSWIAAEREAELASAAPLDRTDQAEFSDEPVLPTDPPAARNIRPRSDEASPGPATSADDGPSAPMFPTSRAARPFPGGHVRLPKLGVVGDSRVHFVGTAFVRRPHDGDADQGRTAFDEYFTFESLFDAPPEGPETGTPDEPYEILGLDPGSPWRQVVATHRRLVKLHHPDALVDADDAAIAAAEERFRQINWAYSELCRTRSV